jgi:hypothetical protein
MDSTWWIILIVGITFYTLWVAGAFRKKKKSSDTDEMKNGGR